MTSVPEPAAADSFPIRQATAADVDAMTDALTTAFFHDPVWGPVFPDESRRAEQSAIMWRAYAASALRYPWTFVTPLGAPAYLESTNPANDRRYQSVGFEPRGEIVMPGGQVVTTMWRSPRQAG